MKAKVVMFTRMNCKLYEYDCDCTNIYIYMSFERVIEAMLVYGGSKA